MLCYKQRLVVCCSVWLLIDLNWSWWYPTLKPVVQLCTQRELHRKKKRSESSWKLIDGMWQLQIFFLSTPLLLWTWLKSRHLICQSVLQCDLSNVYLWQEIMRHKNISHNADFCLFIPLNPLQLPSQAEIKRNKRKRMKGKTDYLYRLYQCNTFYFCWYFKAST